MRCATFALCAGEEIVDAQHVVSGGKQGKVPTEEIRAAVTRSSFTWGRSWGGPGRLRGLMDSVPFNATLGSEPIVR
jgi:hypothetical protein